LPIEEFQMDLLDLSQFYKTNNHYRYIMLVVDIFSRKAYAEPLKRKTPNLVLIALKKIFENSGFPKTIASDNGSEWKNVLEQYLNEKKIIHRMNQVGDHRVLGIIDRLSRTIKNKIYQNFTENKNTQWVPLLKSIIQTYNDTPHSSLNDMSHRSRKISSDTRKIHAKRVKEATGRIENFRIGDHVRILLKKRNFQRGYDRKWTNSTFQIIKIEGRNYHLSNDKSYRAHQLQKVTKEDKGEKFY